MRSRPEWIGKTDDDPVPPRVKIRIFLKFAGICCECGLRIGGKRWICDHRIALINGGENRERNLGPIHEDCSKTKTAVDVAEKAVVYKKTAKALGVKLKRSKPFPGSRASKWKRKLDGTVVRR
jgi:hypothetical protein